MSEPLSNSHTKIYEHLHRNQKARFNAILLRAVSMLKDFSRRQVVTYTLKSGNVLGRLHHSDVVTAEARLKYIRL